MNKCLLITGASSDVGIKFIQREINNFKFIIAHYCHSSDKLEQLKEQFGEKIKIVQADFTSLDSTRALIDKIKQTGLSPEYILHLPADKYHNEKFHKISWEAYQKSIEIQLRSIVFLLQAFLPEMSKNHFGRIVFMLSSCTQYAAPKYLADYVTVKYALLGLMCSLASEYAGKGITINGISPGMMETKLLSDVPELIIQQNAMENPAKRNIKVEDILSSVSLLLSEDIEMLTGQNIRIMGGK